MSLIDRLDKQVAELGVQWSQTTMCTDPADREAAEGGILMAYASAGLGPPERIVWCDGPASLLLTRLIACAHAVEASDALFKPGRNVCELICSAFFRAVEQCSLPGSYREPAVSAIGELRKALLPVQRRNPVAWRYLGWNPVMESLHIPNETLWKSVMAQLGKSVDCKLRPEWLRFVLENDKTTRGIDGLTGKQWNTMAGQYRVRYEIFLDGSFCCDYCGTGETNSEPVICMGQNDGEWLPIFDCLVSAGVFSNPSLVKGPIVVSQNAGWWIPHERVCWISERPRAMNFDAFGRLHCDDGPALAYRDGLQLWYWHGVRVQESVIKHPEQIRVEDIERESNSEVRRAMIERYGPRRYLLQSGAQEVQSDAAGTLYRKKMPSGDDFVMVKVINSTPEPDGTRKEYYLQVPPNARTAREAVAWTFGMRETDYRPIKET